MGTWAVSFVWIILCAVFFVTTPQWYKSHKSAITAGRLLMHSFFQSIVDNSLPALWSRITNLTLGSFVWNRYWQKVSHLQFYQNCGAAWQSGSMDTVSLPGKVSGPKFCLLTLVLLLIYICLVWKYLLSVRKLKGSGQCRYSNVDRVILFLTDYRLSLAKTLHVCWRIDYV